MTNDPGAGASRARKDAAERTADATASLHLTRTSAAEHVAELLTRRILDGTLRAGERLTESAFTSSLGYSRNSVREGIRLLEQSRLVRYEMHRGAVVATPSLDELDDLYRARTHLEGAAVVAPASAESGARLRAAFATLAEAAHSGGPRDLVAADMAFHAEIVAMLGSRRIDAFYRTITTEMGYYLLLLSYTDDEHRRADELVVPQHRALLEAIASGDASRARATVLDHLRENHERIREILADAADA
ncbi:GntR family transcriptional regulator [Microbacterium betulae]|uniref:GntR family transcriptional regulator n=1 Tax=Microbacterium betulae TaxID=2981139 RepID=A0AA97FIK7_9MICO|nr:GntR family transcriptional regulator [Microbacterium sp. AB]WOF23373.1 GntR family transcriptional regulator [Microbacterium sp. AB]